MLASTNTSPSIEEPDNIGTILQGSHITLTRGKKKLLASSRFLVYSVVWKPPDPPEA